VELKPRWPRGKKRLTQIRSVCRRQVRIQAETMLDDLRPADLAALVGLSLHLRYPDRKLSSTLGLKQEGP
jgi:hypothetical protein